MLKGKLKQIYNKINLLAQSYEGKILLAYTKKDLSKIDISSKEYIEAIDHIKKIDQKSIAPSYDSRSNALTAKASEFIIRISEYTLKKIRK